MGCVASKKAVSVTPAVDSSGVLRDHHHSVDRRQDDEAGSEAAILASSLRYRGGRAHPEKEGREDEKVGGASGGDDVGSQASGKCSANDASSRNWNLHKYIEGEQAAAGWPAWLSAVAGEAIQGWVPLKADSFEKLEKIGQGTYSSVFRARDLESGKIFALKKVRFDNFEPESVRFMAREIQILRKLDHPNVMKLEGLITSRLSCSLYLVFEYMEHDLAGLSSSPDIKLSEPQIKCYTQQLLSGLEHCHSRGIIHRDIKGANLLVNNQGILKIADFGLANFVNLRHKQPLTSRVVTLWYRPPELLLGSTDYEASVDLWSVGCVFAEMFCGRPILQGRTEVEQLHKIFKLCGSPPDEYWKKSKLPHATLFKPHRPYESCLLDTFRKLPTNAVSLLKTFLSVEPYKRCTASTALASEYFRTKPYACEPSTLPKYPPCKEIDAKAREETQRRKLAGRLRGAAGAKRQPGEQRALGEPIVTHKVADLKEDSQINVTGVDKNDAKQGVTKVNGETRLFVDLKPMPTIRPRESHHVKHGSTEGIAFSGPLHVPASSGFAWAKRQREENAYGRSQVKPSSRSHFSGAVDAPNGLPTKIINSKGEENGDANSKGQESGDAKDIHGDSKTPESYELTKHAIMKKWSRLQRPDSFDSEMYNSQDLSQVFNGDPASRRHKISGYGDQGDRVEFSGPLLSQSHKVDELLQNHERQIRQAVRRSWFQKVAGRKQGK